MNLATQRNHHHVASRSLARVHFEVTKHSKYTLYFTDSTLKANSSVTKWNAHYAKSSLLEKLKQLLTFNVF